MKNHILVFDFDGTIADTFHHTMRISNQLSYEFNFNQIEPHEINFLKDKTSVEIIQHLKVPFMKIPYIVARAKSELHKNIHAIELIDGLKETLLDLKCLGYGLGILSSNSLNNVTQFLSGHAIECFDFIQSSSRIWGKNIGLNKMIQDQKWNPSQIIYIGDETRDIEAAQKSGIKVVAVTWGYNSAKVLASYSPDYLVHSPVELKKLFERGLKTLGRFNN